MRVANEVFATSCIISLGSCERDGSLFKLSCLRPIRGQCFLFWPIRGREIFALSRMFRITWILTHLSRFYPLHKSTRRRGTLAKSRERWKISSLLSLFYYSARRHLVWWSYVWISNLYKWDRYFSIEEIQWKSFKHKTDTDFRVELHAYSQTSWKKNWKLHVHSDPP